VFAVDRAWRVGLAAAWGLATLALPYSTLYYGHQAAAALLVIAFALLARMARGLDPPSRPRLVLAGAALGWAIVVEYPSALAVGVLGLYAVRALRPRDLGWILVGGLGPRIVLAGYHDLAFGAPWHLPYTSSVQAAPHLGFFGIGSPSWAAMWNITWSSYRGLFFSAPWMALGIPGAILLGRRARPEAIACIAIVTLFLWMNASLEVWYGGGAIGPRHMVPALPFWVVLVAGWFAPPILRVPRAAIAVAIAAVAASALLMIAATAVEPEVDAAISHPWGDYVWPQFWHGELATKSESIDLMRPDVTGARYAWNLGHQLGLHGLASLIPLAAWCVIAIALLHRRIRRSPGPP
jgi:hypothetical protein